MIALIALRAFVACEHSFAGDRESTAASASQAAATIVVSNCRVKFIDEVVLSSQRFGVLDWVVAEGAHIKRGQPVFRLDSRAARATVAIVEEQAKNDVEVRYARKASQLAQVAYLRATSLNQKLQGSVSDLSLREQRLAAEKTLLQLEQAQRTFDIGQLKLQEAQQNLETFQALAPFDGLVRKVQKKRSEAAHEGEPIAELVDTTRVTVEGFVKVEDVDRIAVGTPVEVTVERTDAAQSPRVPACRGCIAFVDVKVEPVTRTLRVSANVDNSENRLRDGLPAQLTIFTTTPSSRVGPVGSVTPSAE